MPEYRIKLAPPDIKYNILEELPKHLSESVRDPGNSLRKFENMVKNKLEIAHALALSTGTGALHLALLSLDIGAGDEVLCPSFTFAATINAISYVGATPVIIDSETLTWNMSPELLKKAIEDRINDGKHPKALLLAHTYGMPAKMEEILSLCKIYRIPVIEDAAGSLGSKYKGKYLGAFGDVGIISFNYNKIITTGGGGMLLTNSKDIREKAAYLATQAKSNKPYYEHRQIGYNYQMNGLAAELGVSQFDSLDDRISKKRTLFENYVNAFSDNTFIQFQKEGEHSRSNRWLTTILLENASDSMLLREKLCERGIEARHLWYPMHLQPVFNHFPDYSDGSSEKLFNHGLALPSGTNLTMDQQLEVAECIKKHLPKLTKS